MLRDELTSDVAGIILECLRSVKGRLTEVSNLSDYYDYILLDERR